LPAGIAAIAACSGGGTFVAPVEKPQRCDCNDRSHGIAAMAISITANKMGRLFLILPICRIYRIFQRFAL
jgi:hypothetical protein